MLPELIRADPTLNGVQVGCQLARKWGISNELGVRLVMVARKLPFPVRIISGFRSQASQEALRADGRPTAPPGRSTHTTCPATGADLQLGIAITPLIQGRFGLAVVESGLRWGGGSPVNDVGIPSDWNHVDLGPRE